MIWQAKKEEFEKLVHSKAWGKSGSTERLNTLNVTLDSKRKAEALAAEHESLA